MTRTAALALSLAFAAPAASAPVKPDPKSAPAKAKKPAAAAKKAPSKAAPAPAGATLRGELADIDVLSGRLSVRLGGGNTIELAVAEGALVTRAAAGSEPKPAPFESLQIGDQLEIVAPDWKSAREIRARAP